MRRPMPTHGVVLYHPGAVIRQPNSLKHCSRPLPTAWHPWQWAGNPGLPKVCIISRYFSRPSTTIQCFPLFLVTRLRELNSCPLSTTSFVLPFVIFALSKYGSYLCSLDIHRFDISTTPLLSPLSRFPVLYPYPVLLMQLYTFKIGRKKQSL